MESDNYLGVGLTVLITQALRRSINDVSLSLASTV